MRRFALAAVLCPAVALANGRAPLTNGVHFQPGDDRALYVSSTFGLLVSRDDGCSFRWICEDNLGYGGTFDPKYRIAADGTIFATTFTGLRVSRDGGCTFTTATADQPIGDPGRIAGTWIDAIDIGPSGEVWVATADGARANDIYRSTDGGATFEPRGMRSPSIWWKSLAIAPSRGQRVYATGYQVAGALPDGGQLPPTGHFVLSDDGGAHWLESPLTSVRFGVTPLPYVVGVLPTNPDVVFMSSAGANPPSGDRLYRSTDGGMTWTEVLATSGPVRDVSIASSGVVIVATLGAAFRSTDAGVGFEPLVDAPQLACVGQRRNGEIYGCAANWQPDFKAVGRSLDGRTWDKLFRFVELAGPVECPVGTPQRDSCASQWPALQIQFGTTGPMSCGLGPQDDTPIPPSKAGCCDAGAPSPGALAALAALCCAVTLRRRGAR
jgi:hypothetical protein